MGKPENTPERILACVGLGTFADNVAWITAAALYLAQRSASEFIKGEGHPAGS